MPRTETTAKARAPKPAPDPIEVPAPETPEQPSPEAKAKATHRLEVQDPLPGHGYLVFEADRRATAIITALPAGEQAIIGQRLDGALRQILTDKGYGLPPQDTAAGTPPTRGRILTTLS